MIGRITGTLLEKNPPQILVDVHGVGYEIDVPMSTFYNLPATGAQVSLHTHHVVREDGHFLFGFATEEERATFRQLLKVSGIGAHGAGRAVRAVGQRSRPGRGAAGSRPSGEDPGYRQEDRRAPVAGAARQAGQGAAEHGRRPATAAPGTAPDAKSDILNALLALGYNEREALGAMKGLDEAVGVSDGIRQALKLLSKG
ncbi:Holliday junction branch migration protein RuvA [Thauera humireducens]|uniref:Holliday junction branch migration protein RuvA n=1 Tax=Thauera humireducens TaxID=1134435 RepID=UPI003C7093FA